MRGLIPGSVNECRERVESFRVRQRLDVKLRVGNIWYQGNEALSDVGKSLIVGAYVSYPPLSAISPRVRPRDWSELWFHASFRTEPDITY